MSSQFTSLLNTSIRVAAKLSLFIIVMLVTSEDRVLAAPPDTMPIWRAQIYVETFDISEAGTDDHVRVEFNLNNITYLDSPADDWERGTARTYDLRLDGVSRLSDIDYLRVSKTGSNGWCIGRIRLIVNGARIYDEQFLSGLWLDNEDGHTRVYLIDDSLMRQRDIPSSEMARRRREAASGYIR